jgi:pimeloyl-ACP methyl ester carboxylesterase
MRYISNFLIKLFLGLDESKKDADYFEGHSIFTNYNIRKSPDIVIPGYLYIPDNPSICNVLLHGISENRRSFVDGYNIKDKMNPENMYYIPDYRGFGNSDLEFDKTAVFDDLYFSLEHLSDKYKIKDFVIIGQSMGATLGLHFYNYYQRNRDPNKIWQIRNVYMFSPFSSTKDVVKEFIGREISKMNFIPNFFSSLAGLIPIPDNINFEFSEIDSDINRLGNILGFHGETDDVVSSGHSRLLQEKFNILVKFDDQLGHVELFKDKKYWGELGRAE